MGTATLPARPKARSPRPAPRPAQVSGTERTAAPVPSGPLGAFYGAGPVMTLGSVQTKLTVGQANDPYEREADQVADRVVSRQPAPPITPIAAGGLGAGLQPKMVEEERKEEAPVQRQAVKETEEPEKKEAPELPIQRKSAPDEEEVQRKPSATGPAGPPDVSQAIRRPGGGEPLDPDVRRGMESSTGRDFSGVRVHGDGEAQSAARALNARAFTHGRDVWLGPGESARDQRLMAHEAAHVAQQGGAPAGRAPASAPTPVTQRLANEEDETVQRQPKPGAPGPAPAAAAAPAPPAEEVAPGEIDLKGLPELLPEKVPESIASYLEGRGKKGKKGKVMLRFGTIAAGPAEMRKVKDKFLVVEEALPLNHPLFARIGEVAPELQPCLLVNVGTNRKITGKVGMKAGKKVGDLATTLQKGSALLGLPGFIPELGALTNTLAEGRLLVGAKDFTIKLGKVLSGTFSFELADGEVTTLGGSLNVAAKGVVNGGFALTRTTKGGAVVVTGKGSLAVNLPSGKFSGNVEVNWDGEHFSGVGKVGYTGEKLSGSVTLHLMEKGLADKLEAERKAPPEAETAPAAATTPAKAEARPKAEEYVVFGEGDLNFSFTDWLNGTAHVIVDPKGFVTIIGKITPQKEFRLFPPQSYNKPLFDVEARASYGLPYIAEVFIFAGVKLSADAGIQGKLYDIVVEGTYSTDPDKAKDFSVAGTLNISASASLTLRAEVGGGLRVLGHSVKLGGGINGKAGIKGYAKARPVIGYREKGNPGEDKKGEFYIKGDLEVVAQPFVGLSGDLFIELDSPWWSPAPDKTWTWPLFDKEWLIGGSFGVGLAVDYVFGSGKAPSVEYKEPKFSADDFMDDMVKEKTKAKAAEKEAQQSAWKERNEKSAPPPAGPEKPGNAQPGKAAEPPPATSKVKPTGDKNAKPSADPKARTADGKTVEQHQQEALAKGKRPDAKSDAKGKQDHDKLLKAGLAALHAVTARYAADGATLEELQGALKSVRRKFKIFKSIEAVEGETRWKYRYVASDSEEDGPPLKVTNKDVSKLQADVQTRIKAENDVRPGRFRPRVDMDPKTLKKVLEHARANKSPYEDVVSLVLMAHRAAKPKTGEQVIDQMKTVVAGRTTGVPAGFTNKEGLPEFKERIRAILGQFAVFTGANVYLQGSVLTRTDPPDIDVLVILANQSVWDKFVEDNRSARRGVDPVFEDQVRMELINPRKLKTQLAGVDRSFGDRLNDIVEDLRRIKFISRTITRIEVSVTHPGSPQAPKGGSILVLSL